jgi:hypothetical protein
VGSHHELYRQYEPYRLLYDRAITDACVDADLLEIKCH